MCDVYSRRAVIALPSRHYVRGVLLLQLYYIHAQCTSLFQYKAINLKSFSSVRSGTARSANARPSWLLVSASGRAVMSVGAGGRWPFAVRCALIFRSPNLDLNKCVDNETEAAAALRSTLYALRSALCALRSALYALRSTLCALRSTLYALRPALCALRSTLYALRSTLYALRSTLYCRVGRSEY
jgi:hypothetical protein